MVHRFKTLKKFHIRILSIFVLTALVEILFTCFIPQISHIWGTFLRIILLSILFFAVLYHDNIRLNRLVRLCLKDNPELSDKNLDITDNVFDKLGVYFNSINIQNQLLTNNFTEHQSIESSLRNSEQRYRNLIEILPDATLLTDCNGIVILNNHRATTLLGADKDDVLLDSDIYSFVPQQEYEHFSNILFQLKKKQQITSFECLMMKKNALIFNAEVSISAIYDQNNDIYELIFLIRDISERKKSDFEKAKHEEQFKFTYKMEVIGQLAGGLAHDFNNILGAISGYGDIILLRYEKDERLVKYARMILSAAGRASDLTKKLLTFSRKGKLKVENIDIHKIIKETIELLQRTIDKNISVNCTLKASNPFILGDTAQIQSAIINLVTNSRDAITDSGEIHITTENSVLDEKQTINSAYSISPGSYLSISIHDTGSGMDHDVLSHLFEPFFTTKNVGKGTGLGLASVYGTIKSHNGYIDVKSTPGKGSIFTMFIPDSQIHSEPQISQLTFTGSGRGNILVVDDEAVIRHTVKEMLSWLGYSVFTIDNGQDAVDFYKSRSPAIDLVILDIIMPGMDGKECFTILKDFDSNVKVILSTGYRIEDERQMLLNNGIIDILQKPFVSAQLAQIVHFALNR